jgi:broad specificity phosphatase PhoE
VSTRDTKPALWFVRHGESTWNAAGLVQGQACGPVLTAKGRREAARVAESLGDVTITAIHTSDLGRALETATIVGRALGIPLQSTSLLRERNFGVAQGRPLSELASAASGIEGDRVVDADARPPEGESLREMYERVGAFISELEQRAPEGDVLVVTHGGVIRIAQAYCAGVGVEAMTWGPVPNASVWGLGRLHPSAAAVQ